MSPGKDAGGNKIIQRGAEAVIYIREGKIVKERISKGYRVPQLDKKIRKSRTKAEAKLMQRSGNSGVNVPAVGTEGDFSLVMENIRGERVKDVLNSMGPGERGEICRKMGEAVGMLHSSGIIHGDLTTSNMILSGHGGGGTGKLYIIDFGLGRLSDKTEHQAVDLFLLYEALKSTHFTSLEECWNAIVDSYSESCPKAGDVLSRMEKIKKRRRYK